MAGRRASSLEGTLRTAILRAVRAAPAAPVEIVAQRVGCHPDTVRRHRPSRPGDKHTVSGLHPEDRAARLAALVGDCPPRLRRRLAVDHEPLVRVQVAARLACPVELLRRLVADCDAAVRHSVANHPDCPPQALERLAGDPNVDIRTKVACRSDCPPRALIRLAGDSQVVVRRSAAEHPSCPAQQVEALAGDVDATVRRAVSRRNDNTAEVLARLAEDENHWTRGNAASRLVCRDLLERLAGGDADRNVRQSARARLLALDRLTSSGPDRSRGMVAG